MVEVWSQKYIYMYERTYKRHCIANFIEQMIQTMADRHHLGLCDCTNKERYAQLLFRIVDCCFSFFYCIETL